MKTFKTWFVPSPFWAEAFTLYPNKSAAALKEVFTFACRYTQRGELKVIEVDGWVAEKLVRPYANWAFVTWNWIGYEQLESKS